MPNQLTYLSAQIQLEADAENATAQYAPFADASAVDDRLARNPPCRTSFNNEVIFPSQNQQLQVTNSVKNYDVLCPYDIGVLCIRFPALCRCRTATNPR